MTRRLLLAAAMPLMIQPALASAAPRIGMPRARAIALARAPGRIVKAEYEREAGGWRYSFDIRQRGRIQEVGVDARSGRIVEDKFESPKERD